MRIVHTVVALAAILLLVVGVKIVAPVSGGEAYAADSATLNVLKLHTDYAKALPEQKLHDMTFALD